MSSLASKRYKILVSLTAVKQLRALDTRLKNRVKKALASLAEDPFLNRSGVDIKQLHGSENPVLYRLRVGDYRAIYAVVGKQVKITEILHRRKAYKFLD
jgi:mRNA interferase RelE/StbE